MTGEKSLYSSMQPPNKPVTMTVGNNARCPTKGKGMISFVTANGESRNISNVLYVPKIKRNLLSIAAIIDQGHVVKFTKIEVEILNEGGKLIRQGLRRNNLYELNALTTSIGVEILNEGGKTIRQGVRWNNLYEINALTTSTGVGKTKLWHERFGHIGHAILKEMHKHGMAAHLCAVAKMKEPCEACMLGKKQRKAFPLESTNRVKAPLELVHADLCIKMPTQALG